MIQPVALLLDGTSGIRLGSSILDELADSACEQESFA